MEELAKRRPDKAYNLYCLAAKKAIDEMLENISLDDETFGMVVRCILEKYNLLNKEENV